MKKVFYVSLAVSLALIMYAGCKNKTKPVNVPMSIFRVTFSDVDTDGTVSANDEIIVQFDRHIELLSGSVASVFELSNAPTDTFGSSPTMSQTSGHAITITLGTGPDLAVSVDNYVTSQIRINQNIPLGALKDYAWKTNVAGGGAYKSIEGRVGYAAVQLLSAVYYDEDTSSTLTAGDTVTVTFTGDVAVNFTGNYWPGWTFILPVNWDHFGSGAYAIQSASDTVVIYIGDGAKFAVPGTFTIGSYLVDSPSGLDIAINIADGFLTYDVGTSQANVPPGYVDIQ